MYNTRRMQTLGMNSPDLPKANSLPVERRRRTRHKIHTPAYARISGESDGFLLDLNTILDLSEDGMCIQAPSGLGADHVVHLCLELSDAGGPIYTAGKVVWSNKLGRTGIRFGELTETSSQQLKKWFFLNAIAACADSKMASAQNETLAEEVTAEVPVNQVTDQAAVHELEGPSRITDHTSVLAALSAIKREVEALGSNLNAALQLVAGRALTFTSANGAAIAISNGIEIICRASAGTDAPPVGARVSTEYGISAQCIHSGELLYCEDSEADTRVDQEVCRALGIRSIVAVPITQEGSVVGLIEVFSRELKAFDTNANLALQELGEMVEAALARTSYPQRHAAKPLASDEPVEIADVEEEVSEPSSWFGRALLVLALITIAAAMVWVFYPRKAIQTGPSDASGKVQQTTNPPAAPVVLGEQKQLAERGDAAEQYAVGVRYAAGDEVKQDYTEASRWFSMAAAQGNVAAQSTLGAYYFSGMGVTKDYSKAYFWALLAQAGGDEASKYRVQMCASRLPHQQLVAIQEQANQWLKDHQSNSAH